jgi:hypothetical protein
MRILSAFIVLGTASALAATATLGAQLPGDRVNVHLVGLRSVEDTVERWTDDSLVVRHAPAIPRSSIMTLDVWRPRSAWRSGLKYAAIGLNVTNLYSVAKRTLGGSATQPSGIGTSLAIGAGFGLAAVVVERMQHAGEWVPVTRLDGAERGVPTERRAIGPVAAEGAGSAASP